MEDIIEDSLTDKDIKDDFLPHAKIIKYNELDNYKNIDALLPKPKDYVIILIEQAPNEGHWVCICKNHGTIYYFDPYGNRATEDLEWNDKETNRLLDQDRKYILNLLNNSPYPVFYNDFRYQKMEPNINTCGRHVIFFIVNNQIYDRTLEEYYTFMQCLKKAYKVSYDEIVSTFVN
jgi:hypothetical protein